MANNLILFIPIVVAVITSIVAPILLARRQTSSTLTAAVLKEGSDIRIELRGRIDELEKRIEAANDEINKALDQLRSLKSENERCIQNLEDLKKQLEADRVRLTRFEQGNK